MADFSVSRRFVFFFRAMIFYQATKYSKVQRLAKNFYWDER